MKFDYKGAFENWLAFLNGSGQLVVAINTSTDGTPEKVREWFTNWKNENPTSQTKINVIDIAIPYTEPDFDGRGKAAALAACTEPFCILLDLDERIVPSMRNTWKRLAQDLEMSGYDAYFVPSVDLAGDERHYRCGGENLPYKWYLHKNLPYLTRGVVNFARREDGSWDKSKSDSTELVNKGTYTLARTTHFIMHALPHWLLAAQMESGDVPFIYHLGSLDYEQRVRQSAFWKPVWEARDPSAQEPETTLADLEKIPRYHHNLPPWK